MRTRFLTQVLGPFMLMPIFFLVKMTDGCTPQEVNQALPIVTGFGKTAACVIGHDGASPENIAKACGCTLVDAVETLAAHHGDFGDAGVAE